MVRNVGSADRVARIVVGLGIIAAGLYLGSWWGAVGLIPLITAAVGWCPAYCPFGISTRKAESGETPGQD
ncbi:MAG: DUF2892 domain-containing protein [Candidatus Latescibacteria bacterium]|jgi:hypothetical protein|nr:DUF2892 domain-containing protein [Candidatus Latescibacterota bacterium]